MRRGRAAGYIHSVDLRPVPLVYKGDDPVGLDYRATMSESLSSEQPRGTLLLACSAVSELISQEETQGHYVNQVLVCVLLRVSIHNENFKLLY